MTSPDVLYYLVHKGTNTRICNRDTEPVLVDREHLTETLDHYEQATRKELDALTVKEYHERFVLPVLQARESIKRAVKADPLDAPEQTATRGGAP